MIKVRGKWMYYDTTLERVRLLPIQQTSDLALFQFVKTSEGHDKIFNKSTGASKALGGEVKADQDIKMVMEDKAVTYAFETKNNLHLFRAVGNGIGENAYLHDISSRASLGYWISASASSNQSSNFEFVNTLPTQLKLKQHEMTKRAANFGKAGKYDVKPTRWDKASQQLATLSKGHHSAEQVEKALADADAVLKACKVAFPQTGGFFRLKATHDAEGQEARLLISTALFPLSPSARLAE